MLTTFKTLIQSKKFWLTVIGSTVVTALAQFGFSHDILVIVGGLFGTNVLGQGIADSKK